MTQVVPFVHEGLGNSSYLVHAGGDEAFLVDPDRSVRRYIDGADERGWRIVAVFETHLHADFVTGAPELADATGARVYAPAEGGAAYGHVGVRGGDRIQLGDVEVDVRATPSHTPEHVAFVLSDGAAPPTIFSGGSLIVGGAARTDLVAPEMTDPLTRALYREARHAFDDLPDETLLMPTHGGGSFCSVGAGTSRRSNLGAERASNSVLSFAGDEDAFVAWFPTTFPGTPAYYSRMRGINASGPTLVRHLTPPAPLGPVDFAAAIASGTTLDVRQVELYAGSHVPGSLAIPFRSSFPVWLGWLVPADSRLYLIGDGVPVADVLAEARLVGYDRIEGVLDGGMAAWIAAGLPTTSTPLRSAPEAEAALRDGAVLIDVREPDEVAGGAVPDALAIPLGSLPEAVYDVPKNRPVIVTCGVGERAISAASILEREGFTTVASLAGGMDAWRDAGLQVIACQAS